jgi:hypothetical protein
MVQTSELAHDDGRCRECDVVVARRFCRGLPEQKKKVRRTDVEHAVAADKGLSTLGPRSPSRGRAAPQISRGRRAAPAVLLSTIT